MSQFAHNVNRGNVRRPTSSQEISFDNELRMRASALAARVREFITFLESAPTGVDPQQIAALNSAELQISIVPQSYRPPVVTSRDADIDRLVNELRNLLQ